MIDLILFKAKILFRTQNIKPSLSSRCVDSQNWFLFTKWLFDFIEKSTNYMINFDFGLELVARLTLLWLLWLKYMTKDWFNIFQIYNSFQNAVHKAVAFFKVRRQRKALLRAALYFFFAYYWERCCCQSLFLELRFAEQF